MSIRFLTLLFFLLTSVQAMANSAPRSLQDVLRQALKQERRWQPISSVEALKFEHNIKSDGEPFLLRFDASSFDMDDWRFGSIRDSGFGEYIGAVYQVENLLPEKLKEEGQYFYLIIGYHNKPIQWKSPDYREFEILGLNNKKSFKAISYYIVRF